MENKKQITEIQKICLIGEKNCGKSTLVHKFLTGKFEELRATIGGFAQRKIPFGSIEVEIQIWDTYDQERFGKLAPMYYRGARAILVVFDITKYDTFLKADQWLKDSIENNSNPHIILIGNKSDLEFERKVETTEAEEYAKKVNAIYFETSSKNGQNVKEIFIEAAKFTLIDLEKNPEKVKMKDNEEMELKIYDPKIEKKSCCF
ncbi:rab2a member ras oncogene family [Anaeramoeba ignava]|uniref:Rab2a member ras oncogene family n=1 Tax=Anaeramoeba ignava TaxID=1746090 RepID=A0A9Q0LVY9_ANAIG|nr:rab2a member ras oncogene family [Anaeramoeba ignava]